MDDTPYYSAEEGSPANLDLDDDQNQDNIRRERISKVHERLLQSLVNHAPSHEILPLEPEYQHAGNDNTTILHRILSYKPHLLPFLKAHAFLDQLLAQLLNSDSEAVRKFLSLMNREGLTALALAAKERRWDFLDFLLGYQGALEAAEVSRDGGYNCLHQIALNGRSKNSKAKGSGDEKWPDCIKLIRVNGSKELITSTDRNGNTPLHLAVKFTNNAEPRDQLELASQLIDACPELLKILNKSDESPYQYHLSTHRASTQNQLPITQYLLSTQLQLHIPKVTNTSASCEDDTIELFMKNHYMHFKDRHEAAKYLYGKEDPELQMEMDLSEHSLYRFSRTSLKKPSPHWKFENILRYVHFPEVHLEELSNSPHLSRDLQPILKKQGQSNPNDSNDAGIGRQDLKAIFDFLRDHCKVKKIIKVKVLDDENPHSDQIIEESLKGFDVEVLDWSKPDICSETIFKAAPKAQEVHLYSSGINAVLHAWSGIDGLRKLSELKTVHIVIRQRQETYKRTQEMLEVFKARLKAQVEGIKITGQVESYSMRSAYRPRAINSASEGVSQQQSHVWITRIKAFANFIVNLNISAKKGRNIRVALLDNGVDGSHAQLEQFITLGISYCGHPGHDGQLNSYWAPSQGHGTQMASLIRDVCPKVDLYVARIQDMEAEHSRQIEIESVIKAINWAVHHNVDIISMSWTIERTPDNCKILDQGLADAIKGAYNAKILMFCSTDDQGKLSKEDVYPGQLPGTFKIGAAKASGNEAEYTDKNSDYTFPGEALRIDIPRHLRLNKDNLASGSSLATALASGTAALLLYCFQIVNDKPQTALQDARSYHNMDRAFRSMTDQARQPKYIRAWEHLKPEFKDWDLPEEEAIEKLKTIIEDLFK